MNTDKATPELFAALSKAQGEIENASKSSSNPHFKSKYADLAEILNTVRPVFAKHGLSLVQAPSFDGAMASVTTILAHDKGGFLKMQASCVPAKSDAQGIGAATTYLRRYSAAAAAGIAQEDDDGNAAAHNRKPAPLGQVTPLDGVWEAQSEESREFLQGVADQVLARIGDPLDAFDYIESQQLDTDERSALWSRLDSKTRAALKKAHATRKNAE